MRNSVPDFFRTREKGVVVDRRGTVRFLSGMGARVRFCGREARREHLRNESNWCLAIAVAVCNDHHMVSQNRSKSRIKTTPV